MCVMAQKTDCVRSSGSVSTQQRHLLEIHSQHQLLVELLLMFKMTVNGGPNVGRGHKWPCQQKQTNTRTSRKISTDTDEIQSSVVVVVVTTL